MAAPVYIFLASDDFPVIRRRIPSHWMTWKKMKQSLLGTVAQSCWPGIWRPCRPPRPEPTPRTLSVRCQQRAHYLEAVLDVPATMSTVATENPRLSRIAVRSRNNP